MLSLKVAQLYADTEIRTATLDRQMEQMRARFAAFKVPRLDFRLDTTFANQQLGDIEARLRRVSKLAGARLGGFSGLGGGGLGGGGRSGRSDPNFIPLASLQFSSTRAVDQVRSAAAAAEKAAAAQDRLAARQAAASEKAAKAQAAKASRAATAQLAASRGNDPNFVPLASLQFSATKAVDQSRAAAAAAEKAAEKAAAAQDRLAARQAAAADRAAKAQIAADARVQAALQRSVAAQAAAASRAYDRQVAAAERAAAQQIAADARVQAAQQRSVAAQAAAASRAYAARTAAAEKASRQEAASRRASAMQFASGASMGLGLPIFGSPAMMGGQVLGMGVSAMASGLKASAETAIDLESKMAEVRRVAGLGADETGRLKQELIDISTVQPGVAIDDLIKMADIGGRMGLKGGELKEFAGGLAMVKNAVSGMETEDLANNMARVLHVFQLGPEYIKGFGSALTAMDNATTASASDILKITQGLSGTAAAIGLTLPQVVALSAALRDAGLSNAVASSSFSQIFRKMATESADFARVAGVDAKAFEDAYRRGPLEALGLLMKGLASADDSIEKLGLLKELGLDGVRSSGAVLQFGQVMEKVAGMVKEANGEFTSLKALLDADAIKGDTAAASIGKLGNVLTEIGDDIGQFALPAIKRLTGDLLEFKRACDTGADGWASLRIPAKAFADTVGSIPGIGQWIGSGANKFAGLIPGAPNLGGPNAGGKALPKKAEFVGPIQPPPDPAARTIGGAPAGTVPDAFKNVLWDQAAPAAARSAGSDGKAMDLGSIAGRAFGGIGQRASNAVGVGGILADSLKSMLPSLADSLKPIARPSASVGLSGADFGRQQQQDILNGAAKDTARNTATAADVLTNMYTLMQKAKGNAVNALLGPN